MQDIHRFISFSRTSTAIGLCWLLALGGCSSQSSRLDDVQALFETASKDPGQSQNNKQPIVVAATKPALAPVVVSQAAASAPVVKPELRKSVIVDAEPMPAPARVSPVADTQANVADAEQSSWCTSLRETALANGNILRSPILAGSYDNLGKAEMSVGLSYSNFHRADLLQARAEAECRKYMAQTGLQRLVFAAPQNLTMAGFKAKADAIEGEKFELARLRRNVMSHMAKGDINREKATALLTLIDQLHADGQSARSQAARRLGNFAGTAKPAKELGVELLRAEQDLDQIDSQIRTSENFDVGVEGLYSEYTNGVPNGASTSTQGFGGKVSFSMKLGVIDPRRFEHERLASEAKHRAIRDEAGGPIWQVAQLRDSHERAIAGLEQSRIEIAKAVAEVKHLLTTLSDVSQPEFAGARLNAQFQLLKLRADDAAVAGSLADIRHNISQLSNG